MQFVYNVAMVIGALFLITLLQGIRDARSGLPEVRWYTRTTRLLQHLILTIIRLGVLCLIAYLTNITGGFSQMNYILKTFVFLTALAIFGGVAQGILAIISSILEAPDQLNRRFGQGPHQP